MDQMQVGPVLDGRQLTETGGGTFEVVNPATGKPVARELCCDAADVDRIWGKSIVLQNVPLERYDLKE